MRALIHFPIIHSLQDLGKLGEAVSGTRTEEQAQKHAALIDNFWSAVEEAVDDLDLDCSRVRLYQDGLPVCGRESAIVTDLAATGSRNHLLLQALARRGATIMGTESPQLLLEEYELMKQLLQPLADQAVPCQTLARSLLSRRDAFIARRIDETLQAGEIGLLFLGLMHAIEEKLPPDITLIHPIGKPDVAGSTLTFLK